MAYPHNNIVIVPLSQSLKLSKNTFPRERRVFLGAIETRGSPQEIRIWNHKVNRFLTFWGACNFTIGTHKLSFLAHRYVKNKNGEHCETYSIFLYF